MGLKSLRSEFKTLTGMYLKTVYTFKKLCNFFKLSFPICKLEVLP